MTNIARDAHTVLFPAFAGTELSDEVKQFLDKGGLSILLGETRDEYVARHMSKIRVDSETADTLANVCMEARRRSGQLLAAVDQELAGISRLHSLVPNLPNKADLVKAEPEQIEELANAVAREAGKLGINVFLAPILDVVIGANPWLFGRTWSTEPETISAISSAYIRGVQKAGVAATAKHFPGFSHMTGDPAIDEDAITITSLQELEGGLRPFRDAIDASVAMIMVGPAIVRELDPHKAALRSKPIIDLLKSNLGFQGIVMADDLDAKATLRGDPIESAAIDALNAGCDFLMLADAGTQIEDVAKAVQKAADSGIISPEKLARSAQKLRELCLKYDNDKQDRLTLECSPKAALQDYTAG